MERLSSLDAVFLAVENPHTPMNIGSVALFDGPAPSADEVRNFLEPRLDAIPRCRQRVRQPRGWFGRPVWIDDLHFDLDNHLHTISLTDDDEAREFDDLVADLLATPLDRRRPLWRVWIVNGARPNQWALVAMVHHCLVDGIAGNDLLTAVLTKVPVPESGKSVPWHPSPEPSRSAIISFDFRVALATARSRFRGLVRVLAHPRRSWSRIRRTIAAAKKLWYRQPHLPTSLVGPIGRERRWRSLSVPMIDIQSVQSNFACTVNDVVVAGVTGGLRDLLIHRGEVVEGRTVTAMVPVSLRKRDERGSIGNRVANVHALLPVGIADATSRMHAVQSHLNDLKTSDETVATGLLMNIGEFVPRIVADRIARAVVQRQRTVETAITNVPGPREMLYLGSHRMVAAYPVAPIAGQVRITVAVWSYCEDVYLGITGDRETTPDIDMLVEGIKRGFDEVFRLRAE